MQKSLVVWGGKTRCLKDSLSCATIAAIFLLTMSDPDCIFCKIVAGNIPANKVYEDDQVLAFHDINPKAKIHILIIPKKHLASLTEMTDADEMLVGHMAHVSKKIAAEHGLAGYKTLFNVNKEGGQVVFHLHMHLLGGGKIDLAHC